jgi:L-cysteate sulfo-lyase
MDISRFPRLSLGHLPTPLEAMPNLARQLAGPRLFVKRDDNTGLALGGNKTRKLEFALGAALRDGADLVITSGGTQSNSVRQVAAACARLRLPCQCVIANPLKSFGPEYLRTGNVLLDEILGAEIYTVDDAEGALAHEVDRLAQQARSQGRRPCVIPVGCSDAVGSLGYVACAAELLAQCWAAAIKPSHVIVATGSAGTQAGLLTGLRLERSDIRVVGIAVSESSAAKRKKVRTVIDELTAHLGVDKEVVADRAIEVLDDYVGAGYAMPSAGTIAAVRLAAAQEGLILDPVYTGKAMAGLIDLVGSKKLAGARDVVFLHTGGSPALFAYAEEFCRA